MSVYISRWVLRRASAWFCAIVGIGGLEATPVRHEGWRLYPLVFGAMIFWATWVAWQDAKARRSDNAAQRGDDLDNKHK